MQYLCDRMEPPIPCELVRGYLEFMPHAWNIILVKKGDSLVRMVVDACHPHDIREETDPEYYCRSVFFLFFISSGFLWCLIFFMRFCFWKICGITYLCFGVCVFTCHPEFVWKNGNFNGWIRYLKVFFRDSNI